MTGNVEREPIICRFLMPESQILDPLPYPVYEVLRVFTSASDLMAVSGELMRCVVVQHELTGAGFEPAMTRKGHHLFSADYRALIVQVGRVCQFRHPVKPFTHKASVSVADPGRDSADISQVARADTSNRASA